MGASCRYEHSVTDVLVDPERSDSVILEELGLQFSIEVEALGVDGIDFEFELLREPVEREIK